MTEKHLWWKILGAILMLLVLYFGLLTPLKHGIVNVRPDRFPSGQQAEMMVEAYNSNYSKTKSRVFLKHQNSADEQDYLLEAVKVTALNDNQLKVQFDLPPHIPDSRTVALFSLIVDNEIDGASVIPSKIIIRQDSINEDLGKKDWTLKSDVHFNLKNPRHFPYRNILVETIRNTFFHVSLWFAMFLLLSMSVYYSFKYLRTNIEDWDLRSYALVRTALFFGILGCLTGSVWARYTWETWWTTDIKLNMAALTILIYLASLILRSSIEDRDRKARISSAYNIFALVAVIPLIFVLPRLTDSLHPGNGGNPAIGSDDMDNALRIVFYPSVLAFMLIGLWMASLLYRADKLNNQISPDENNL